MIVVTSRADFEKLTAIRMREAKLLLDQNAWGGAYYMAGYAVEFAFKVIITSQLIESDSFPDKKDVEKFYKHDLKLLLEQAGLGDDVKNDDTVSRQWDIVKDWSEQSRYVVGRTEPQARDLYNAIEKDVLPWIKARW